MIRGATADDYMRFAELFRELAFEEAAPSRVRWIDELARHTLISERDGRVDGYITFVTLSNAGHVRNLVVAPEARKTGIGSELMRTVAGVLRARGIDEWHLNVKVGNAPAIALYEKLGLAIEHRSTILSVPIARIGELPREAAIALPVSADEDDDIERALGLLAGRVAMTRMRSETILVQLRDTHCAPVGFAAYDRKVPGAMPFRVLAPRFAPELITALLPYVHGACIQLVVEDDDELRDALLAIGAESRRELLHYRGATSAACATSVS